MPDFHRLNKSKTTEMSREELNRRLKEEVGKSAAKQSSKNSSQKKPVKKTAEDFRTDEIPDASEKSRKKKA